MVMKMNKDYIFEIGEIHHLVGKTIMKSEPNTNRPTASQIRFIDYLATHKEVYQSDFEREFNISRATVYDVLNTMGKKGIITREKSSVDTRKNRVILNKDVLDHHMEVKKKINDINRELVKYIDINDLFVFSKVLEQMNKNMHNLLEGSDIHD